MGAVLRFVTVIMLYVRDAFLSSLRAHTRVMQSTESKLCRLVVFAGAAAHATHGILLLPGPAKGGFVGSDRFCFCFAFRVPRPVRVGGTAGRTHSPRRDKKLTARSPRSPRFTAVHRGSPRFTPSDTGRPRDPQSPRNTLSARYPPPGTSPGLPIPTLLSSSQFGLKRGSPLDDDQARL